LHTEALENCQNTKYLSIISEKATEIRVWFKWEKYK